MGKGSFKEVKEMSNFISVKVEDNSKEFLEAFEKQVPVILEEWGLAGERFAKEEITKVVYDTPQSPTYKRTGRLRGSLTYKTQKNASKPQAPATGKDAVNGSVDNKSVIIGSNVEYAAYVEMGSSRMRPRPYLKPAIEGHKKEFEEILENNLTG